MPYRRKRIRRVTMGKDPIKHSNTLVNLTGNASAVTQSTLIKTNAGDRSDDGSSTTIQDRSNTAGLVQVGTIVKYINIILQAATTEAGNDQQTQTQGWIEWAVVWRDEVSTTIPSTNIGIRTLGDICSQMFRGDCLMTGQFPVSVNLPNVERIIIKLPKKSVKWHLGDELTLYYLFRDAESADMATNTIKVISSNFWKSYV